MADGVLRSRYLAFSLLNRFTEVNYVSLGLLCVSWSALFFIFIAENPADQRGISQSELDYLTEGAVNDPASKEGPPLKQMLLSVPLWSFHLVMVASGYVIVFMLLILPTFVDQAFRMGILMVWKSQMRFLRTDRSIPLRTDTSPAFRF